MKRRTPKLARWHQGRARRLSRAAKRSAGHAKRRRLVRQRRHGVVDQLAAPAYFTLWSSARYGDAPREFFQFLARLRTFDGTRLHIDMSRVGRIVAPAGLVFKAELSYLHAKGVQLSGTAPRKTRTLQVLTQTGLCELLHISPAVTVDREDTVHWTFTSGAWDVTQPNHLAALLGPAAQASSSSLYTGLVETVSNCIEHAYLDHPSRRRFGAGQDGWWAFQQLRDGKLSTCICDLGIGVAAALPLRLADEPSFLHMLMNRERPVGPP